MAWLLTKMSCTANLKRLFGNRVSQGHSESPVCARKAKHSPGLALTSLHAILGGVASLADSVRAEVGQFHGLDVAPEQFRPG
jgi:hypothetical protein